MYEHLAPSQCICNHEGAEDCFGRNGISESKVCRILNNTDFGGRMCPFYKSRVSFKLGQALHGGSIGPGVGKEIFDYE